MKKIILFIISLTLFFNFGVNLPQKQNTQGICQTIEFQGNTNYANPFEQCTSAVVANSTGSFPTLYNLNNNSYVFNGANLYTANGSNTTYQALVMRFNNPMPSQFTYYISAYMSLYANLVVPNSEIYSYFYRADGTIVNYKNNTFFKDVSNTEYDGLWFDENDVQYGIASFTLPFDDIVRFEIRTKFTAGLSQGTQYNSFRQISYGTFAETQYSLGYEDGYQVGEENGYNTGYDAGFLDGSDNIAQAFFNGALSIIELVFSSLVTLFSTQLVVGTPITIGLIFLGIPGAFMILSGVINLVRRLLGN